ncbi:Protein LSM12-like [Gracilariopsis chorda]|uniref:Protein LSM12-like n=1 Tax=Gracilariopsis chorda TaxID=448386 RepID=A0A2V3IFB2_9FLOR|nr:Protein LSM12-like [Gracilariopsis chorda]|eukprot:PXF40764.1 Protein LSM12-like [Gracilariopsis chorda]
MDARPQPGMKFEVGKPIAIQLNDGSFLRGFVHAEDKGAALLCLELIPSAKVALVSIVNIKSASPLTQIADTRKWPSNFHIDLAKLRAEERRICEKREAEFNKLGVGVSPSAQAIFDTLAKTMPCKWDGEDILILDTVRLAPPYNAKCLSGDTGVVERVKMILENEAHSIRNATDANGVKP